MMKKPFRLLILLAGLFFVQVLQAREVRIHVAVTSDVHARLFSYDFINNRPATNSLANVHSLMLVARARQSNGIIFLDNGDMLQGTPAAYYANFVQESKQNLFSRVMNLMRYDAATIGNHDIEAGPAVYNRLREEFRFPYLGANVLDAETGQPYFEPYTVIRRQGIRIAVIGLTTPSVPNWLPPHLWEGLAFQDMVEAARYWVEHVAREEKPDAIIGLFHSGMGPSDPPADAHPLENASGYIARNVPGFDVIFTGHDHRERAETITNVEGRDVLVIGPGHFAESLAVAELIFNRIERRVFVLEDKKAEILSTGRFPPNQAFFSAFEKDMTEIIAFCDQPVARLNGALNAREALFGSSPVVDIVHHVQLQLTGADVSFTAPLIFDQEIRPGQLRVRDFFRLYEYENYLYTMELSGREILDYLEYSYGLWLNEEQGEADPLLGFRRDRQGQIATGNQPRFRLQSPFYSFDSAAGIRYHVDLSKPAGSRVTITGMEDGSDFSPVKTYSVAINSYRGSGGGGHLTEGAGISHSDLQKRITNTSEKDLRSAMIDYFREMEVINAEKRGNWEIIPASRIEERMEKDLKILFD